MYKLVAIDLDGTMLNSYGIVTENTKNVIKKVKRGRKKDSYSKNGFNEGKIFLKRIDI